MRITWVSRSLLDYYIPLIARVNERAGGQLTFITSGLWSPPRVLSKLKEVLGGRALILTGEKSIGEDMPLAANVSVCIPYQPGLLKAIGQSRPDVLIGDGFFQWTSFALAHRILHGTGLVVGYERTFHTERNSQWYRTAYRRMVLRYVDAVCCNGSLSVEYTRWLGMSPGRITLGRMAADTDGLSTQAGQVSQSQRQQTRESWESQGLVFLYVGQLIARKGLKEMLDGWSLFEKAQPGQGTLVIVGQGPEEGSLRRQAAELGLRFVRFQGAVDYDQIACAYASADAFAIPTLEDNWSLVVPEAMSCGLPILCSRYIGCWPELIRPGNGWVFDPLDPRDIQRVLQRALESRANLPAMGDRSRQIVRDYSPDHAADALFKACEIAVQRGKNR